MTKESQCKLSKRQRRALFLCEERGANMVRTRGQLLSTDKGQDVGKQQLYALLVNTAGVAVLDALGNEQVVEIKAGADGKILTSASITGSLANIPVEVIGGNAKVGNDLDAVWADSALINTAVNVDVALPTVLQGNAKYLVEIYNPSANTALTVITQNKADAFAGATRYPELTRWSVAASGIKAVVIEGWLLDAAGRLVLSNDTALAAGQGFTATIRIIKI